MVDLSETMVFLASHLGEHFSPLTIKNKHCNKPDYYETLKQLWNPNKLMSTLFNIRGTAGHLLRIFLGAMRVFDHIHKKYLRTD